MSRIKTSVQNVEDIKNVKERAGVFEAASSFHFIYIYI